jgi:hypothetical protein
LTWQINAHYEAGFFFVIYKFSCIYSTI